MSRRVLGTLAVCGLILALVAFLDPLSLISSPGAQRSLGVLGLFATLVLGLWAILMPALVALRDEWLAQGVRFKALGNRVSVIWTRPVGTTRVSWQVHPQSGARPGDVEAFLAEARLASELLAKAGQRTKPGAADPVDDWLLAVLLLTPSDEGFMVSSRDETSEAAGASSEEFTTRSALACTKLAAGERTGRTPYGRHRSGYVRGGT